MTLTSHTIYIAGKYRVQLVINMFKKISRILIVLIIASSMLFGVILAMDLSHPSLLGSFNALGDSGYAIARWPYTDGDVPVGTNVQVRAATTNPDATHVIFVWIANEVEIYRSGKISLSKSDDTWEGTFVYDALNSYTLNIPGDWAAKAYFYDDKDAPYSDSLTDGQISIRAISFHPFVIPEIPYGVIGSLVTMVLAFVLYLKRF